MTWTSTVIFIAFNTIMLAEWFCLPINHIAGAYFIRNIGLHKISKSDTMSNISMHQQKQIAKSITAHSLSEIALNWVGFTEIESNIVISLDKGGTESLPWRFSTSPRFLTLLILLYTNWHADGLVWCFLCGSGLVFVLSERQVSKSKIIYWF